MYRRYFSYSESRFAMYRLLISLVILSLSFANVVNAEKDKRSKAGIIEAHSDQQYLSMMAGLDEGCLSVDVAKCLELGWADRQNYSDSDSTGS